MAVSGHNGNNESFIGMSTSIGLSLYDSDSNNEITISKSAWPIDIIISRDKSVLRNYVFQYVNATSFVFLDGSYFLQNNFNITANNASIHIELKPLNMSIGYLLVLKLGYLPIITASNADYTTFKYFCPSNIILTVLFSVPDLNLKNRTFKCMKLF